MDQRIFKICAASLFLLMFITIAAGASDAAESPQGFIYAGGFVSGQTYQIEFVSETPSRFLACDAEGNLSLSLDENDGGTKWKASSSSGQEFTLSSNGFSLRWSSSGGSKTPVLKAEKENKPPKPKSVTLPKSLTSDDLFYKAMLAAVEYAENIAEQIEHGDLPPAPPVGGGKSTEWTYTYKGGSGSLSGVSGKDTWFIAFNPDGTFTAVKESVDAAAVRLRTDGSLGGGDIIGGAPSVAAPVIHGGRRVPEQKFTIETRNIPQDAEYRWLMDGELLSGEKELVIRNAESLSVGVHEINCEISFTDEFGTSFGRSSWTTNFIVCSGILENSLLTFSDVHEKFENIGGAIAEIMSENDGKIPALVVCTGDWTNVHPSADADMVNNFHIPMLKAAIGGIDTVFVSGNHEPSEPAVSANEATGLGYDGSGVIFRSDPHRLGTSGKIRGLIVFGINYDDVVINDKDSAGKAPEPPGGSTKRCSYENVLPKLETFLETLAADYHGETILISSHTGLHVLGMLAESTANQEWAGDANYNLDKSAEMVELLNSYADEYGMKITFLFGHDHSKGEAEFLLKTGDEIVSTVSFTDQTTERQSLSFTYGHAGFLLNGPDHYTLLTWQPEVIIPEESSRFSRLDGFSRIDDYSWLNNMPATGFSGSHLTALASRPERLTYGMTGLTLMIPELDVSEKILTVPAENGTYPVEWLGSSVGLLEQSSLPGEGVTILTGHNHLNNTEAGPFLAIGTLQEGDRIMVNDADGGLMKYGVYGNYKIASNGFASIADEIRENTLVLITCEDESVDGGYLNRRVIFAEPL